MENIRQNKAQYLAKQGFTLDITKSKDVLGSEQVQVRDILNGKKADDKINRMADIFPRSEQQNDDDLLS